MTYPISDELADNYRELKAQRGCTWEQLAAEQETTDPSVAAWFRSQAEPTRAQGRTEPPPSAPVTPAKKAAPAKPKAPAKKAAPAKPKA